MYLVYSVAAFAALIVIYSALLVATRRPRPPGWATEAVVGNFWCLLMTTLLAYGVAFAAVFASTWPPRATAGELALIAALVAACVVAVRRIAPRRRLADYAAAESAGPSPEGSRVVPIGTASPSAPEPKPDPARGPGRHKAA